MDPTLFGNLQKEASKSPLNLQVVSQLLNTALLQLTASGLLSLPKESLQPNQLAQIRELFEIGAIWSVQSRDGISFERYLSQLTPLYSSPPTPRQSILLGLHLLNLLVTNRRPQYYTTLAKHKNLWNTPGIDFVIKLERCLMEGTFQRLVEARKLVPAPEYCWFVDALLETVRGELAEGMEVSFGTLEVKSAAELLLLRPEQLQFLKEFALKRGWTVENDRIFFPSSGAKVKENLEITQTTILIDRALHYATELEQIV